MRIEKIEPVAVAEALSEAKRLNPAQIQAQAKTMETAYGAALKSSEKSFSDVLNGEIAKNGLQFSKHANMRLNSRNINLSNEQLERVKDGVTEASRKGVRDSLVIVDNVALVVNVRSGMVITAVDSRPEFEKNIFTNIDGAVIV